jgi:uncharacterized protein YndB with AHSA1/START domain
MKKVLIGVVVLVVGFLGFVAMQPNEYSVTRSATVAATPEIVFPMVNDFHTWASWSPWDAMDATMKKTYDGPATGVGATYGWVGNDKVGEGKMTIVDAKPNQEVAIKLEFIKPFAAVNETTFTFAPAAGGTAVTWKMSAHNNMMTKAAGIFMNMDKMIGDDFEKGLAKIKTLAEAQAKAEEEAKAKAAAEAAPAADAPPADPVQ